VKEDFTTERFGEEQRFFFFLLFFFFLMRLGFEILIEIQVSLIFLNEEYI
jgi:hypothetical protein